MTAQVPDSVLYRDEQYDLIGRRGGGLVTAEQFGIEPEPVDTSCWRGFVCIYRIRENKLFLQQMEVRSGKQDYPTIAGVPASPDDLGAVYESLQLPVDFTGKIRLARDFIRQYYVHMGFQKASAYREVLDLTFSGGVLQCACDRSEEAESIRGQFRAAYGDKELMERIADAFSLDMDLK